MEIFLLETMLASDVLRTPQSAAFGNIKQYQDVVTQTSCRRLRIPLRRDVESVGSFQEDVWRRYFVSLDIKDGNLRDCVLSKAFDEVYLTCGGQHIEQMDGHLNAFLLFCKARQRLQWYSNTFEVLRGFGLPKLLVDTILSFCALRDKDYAFFATIGCKAIQICFTFYNLLSEHRAQLLVPLCLTEILRPDFQLLRLNIKHSVRSLRVVLDTFQTFVYVQQNKTIVQTRFHWNLFEESLFSKSNESCLIRFFPHPFVPISAILLRVECNEDVDVAQFHDLLGELTLDFKQVIHCRQPVTLDAQKCFVGRVDKTFWYCLPLFDEKTEPIETILCDDVERVGSAFFYCKCRPSYPFCCNPHLSFKRKRLAPFDITVKIYTKGWNQMVTANGAGTLSRTNSLR